MTEQRYGEDVRPWPERGYFSNCREVLTRVVAKAGFYYLAVWRGEEEAFWRWEVLCFSFTPDGDLYERRAAGMNATQSIAEHEGRAALALKQRKLEKACES